MDKQAIPKILDKNLANNLKLKWARFEYFLQGNKIHHDNQKYKFIADLAGKEDQHF